MSAMADRDFSPPERRVTFCARFPGIRMSMSTPVSRRSLSSVRRSSARPPGKRRVKTSRKHRLTPSKVSENRFREMALIRVIVFWSVSSEEFRSAAWVVRNS